MVSVGSGAELKLELKSIGSARTEVVRFVVCGGVATFLAPGRGTYRLVQSAAFQGCKDRRQILKWWHMRAFSGSVLEWCGLSRGNPWSHIKSLRRTRDLIGHVCEPRIMAVIKRRTRDARLASDVYIYIYAHLSDIHI